MRSVTFILIVLSNLSYAQSVDSILENYMKQLRDGSNKPIPEVVLSASNGSTVLASLRPYTKDTLSTIRAKAYNITKRVGGKSDDQQLRKSAITLLISGIRDEDTGIAGINLNALTSFPKDDFTPSHIDELEKLVSVGTPHLDKLLKLAGYIGADKFRDEIRNVINAPTTFRYKWNARLALARMGDQESIDFLLDKIQAAPVNDDFVYDVVPDLVYTRQPAIYEYLEKIIQSNKANCLSADPDNSDQILCGYRVMEYLAPVIENYPLEVDEFGDLNIDDYEDALMRVRNWFAENEVYEIKRDGF